MENSAEELFENFVVRIQQSDRRQVLSVGEGLLTYRLCGDHEQGILEWHHLFPGIFLQRCWFDCDSVRVLRMPFSGRHVQWLYCLEGRVDVCVSGGEYFTMMKDTLVIVGRHLSVESLSPAGYYRGIHVCLHESCLMSEDTVEEIEHRGVNINRIWERFSPDTDYAVIKADDRFRNLFQSMDSAPEKGRADYWRLKILELLLLTQFLPDSSRDSSMQIVEERQLLIPKQIAQYMMDDLERSDSVSELAHQFDISGASARRYFLKVYGVSIPEYRKRARMLQAQKLLAGGNDPIYEIAAEVGYENASKFAGAFRDSTGMSPSEYRKCNRNRLQQDGTA